MPKVLKFGQTRPSRINQAPQTSIFKITPSTQKSTRKKTRHCPERRFERRYQKNHAALKTAKNETIGAPNTVLYKYQIIK